MRCLFIGSVEFSEKALLKLIDLKAEIVGVVTQIEDGFNSDFVNLTPMCCDNGLDLLKVDQINDQENIDWIKSKKIDVIFCFGFSQILSKDLIDAAPMGVIGYHPAKLPQHRGRHPIVWALVLGLDKTASTLFFTDERADHGDILSEREVTVSYDDNARSLYDKCIKTAINQIKEFYPKLIDGSYERVTQNEEEAGYWRKRNTDDGLIRFQNESRKIYNVVRALTKPYVGAHINYNGKDIKVWDVEEVSENLNGSRQGQVVEVNGESVLVRCADNAVLIKQHEFKPLPKVGEILT